MLIACALVGVLPLPAAGQWCPARGPEEVPQGATAVATLVRVDEPGERMAVTGIVRRMDGRTPVAGAVVYAYHTNQRGAYARDAGATGLAALHGRIRGWAITNSEGATR